MEYYSAIRKGNLAICNDVDGTREHYAKQNKSIRERQLSYDLTDMRNLRNKTEDHRGREGKMKQDKTTEGDKPLETLNPRKQTEGCCRVGG